MVKSQRVLTPGFITHESERHTDAPWGIFGGTEGATGRCVIYNKNKPEEAREMHSKFSGLAVGADDVMAYYGPNGGGYGSPLKRPAQKVLEDVLDGYYSAQHAREVYGVAIDLDSETVDMAETGRLRAKLAQQ
ncbi:hydantoinase B/oxoprolinase family protein [Paracoccus cavernae]|uniref:Hydantoinase B/oxoprolinase family protein n=1 Tax=Paracoccus cavernae TaxID=1571207 RepID=A0ABT8D5C9_9RHOB|nr:hydantoinase B/oxoprolinase family protein [Paracoccus cavernae]